MSVVTLLDYTPAERYDGTPWTRARLQEASAADGTWATLNTITLSPVDADPANPATRDFTIQNATLDNGWYRVVWLDAAQNESATEPRQNLQRNVNYEPTVEDVGALIQQRTSDKYNNQLGTFTADTRPTYEQVHNLIQRAIGRIAGRLGDTMPDSLIEDAANVVALRAAMFVELSFYGDQITVSRGPYKELQALYAEALAELLSAHEQLSVSLGGDDDLAPAGLAVASFTPIGPPRYVPGSETPLFPRTWMDW